MMAFTSHELSVPGVEPARRRRPHPRRGRNQVAGVELGRSAELSALPPCPANLVGDGGALERELDRAREIAFFVGPLSEVSEYLRLAARQAELPECTE